MNVGPFENLKQSGPLPCLWTHLIISFQHQYNGCNSRKRAENLVHRGRLETSVKGFAFFAIRPLLIQHRSFELQQDGHPMPKNIKKRNYACIFYLINYYHIMLFKVI